MSEILTREEIGDIMTTRGMGREDRLKLLASHESLRADSENLSKLSARLIAVSEECDELKVLLDLAFAAVRFADMEHDEERCARENPYMWCADCREAAASDG